MFNFEETLHIESPSQLDEAIANIDLVFDRLDELLKTDFSCFHHLDESVFIYFNREEIFYLNQRSRQLLDQRTSRFEPESHLAPSPIFWLEPSLQRAADDLEVLMSGLPKPNVNELVSLNWGKTWMRGAKRPIRNSSGRSIAVLFSGHEISAAEQIGKASTHCRVIRKESGNN